MSSLDSQAVSTPTNGSLARATDEPAAPASGKDASGRRVIAFVASKGGVGKSVSARALIDLIRMNTTRKVSAWDLDGGTGSLALYYDEDPVSGVGLNNVSDPSQTDWLEAMYDDSVDDIVLDVPGGKTEALYQTFTGGPSDLVKFIRRADRELILVTVIGTNKDSVATVVQSIEMFGDSVTHVVLKNGFWGASNKVIIFDGFEESGRRRFGKVRSDAEKAGASIIYLPRVDETTYALLDHDSITFAKGINEAAAIGRKAAFQAESWLQLVSDAFKNTPLDPAGMKVRAK
jgi:hypothetical protein